MMLHIVTLPFLKMQMSNESSYHHGNLQEALITAALTQIATGGASTLNLSKLAQQLGVTHPAVYRHFASKHALQVCVAKRGFEMLIKMLQDATQPIQNDNFQSLNALASAYISFALEHTELARLMFSMKERVTEAELHGTSKAALVPLFDIVEGAKKQNVLKNNDVAKTVRIIWATIHGLAVLLMDEQMPFVTQTPGELSKHIEATVYMLCIGLFDT
jgi:AcrR family transcriptional regulator